MQVSLPHFIPFPGSKIKYWFLYKPPQYVSYKLYANSKFVQSTINIPLPICGVRGRATVLIDILPLPTSKVSLSLRSRPLVVYWTKFARLKIFCLSLLEYDDNGWISFENVYNYLGTSNSYRNLYPLPNVEVNWKG